jgi:hypothetical protein
MERIKKTLENNRGDRDRDRNKNRSVARDTAEEINKDIGLLSIFAIALLGIIRVFKEF